MNFQWSQVKYGIIIGAGHGIGYALTANLLEHYPKLQLTATYRVKAKAEKLLSLQSQYQERLNLVEIDPTQENEVAIFANEKVIKDTPVDFIFNCVGLLHNESFQPEKSLRDFSVNNFLEVIRINSSVTPLLAKYLEKKFPRASPSLFVSLSAKVGSNEDNKLGGWYSYRAAKAALNMLVKNISIEFSRKRLPCLVCSLHPGTTNTALSEPFLAHTTHEVHAPEVTADHLIKLFSGREVAESGIFLSWNGEKLPW